MRSSWIILLDPKSSEKGTYKREKRGRPRHRRESHVKTKADIRIRQQQIMKCLQPLPAVEESRNDSSLEPLEAV